MDIELTDEQKLLRETCRDFADRELKPNAKRWDREHKYPAEAVKKMELYRKDWLIISDAPSTARRGYSRNSTRVSAR